MADNALTQEPMPSPRHDPAMQTRMRNIELDRINSGGTYFGTFSQQELQRYIQTGREPPDVIQRMNDSGVRTYSQ